MLLIEADPGRRALLLQALAISGHPVDWTDDVTAACALPPEAAPDVILVDLPVATEPTGEASLARLRERWPTARIVTAATAGEPPSAAPEAGRRLLRDMLESLPFGIAAFDPAGRLQAWNRPFAALFAPAPDALSPGLARAALSLPDLPDRADEYAGGAAALRHTGDGRVVEHRSLPLPGGGSLDLYGDVGARHAIEERMRYLATHDTATGLANRLRFREALAAAIARRRGDADRPFAVLALDIDRFKALNESLGHLLGDEVLTLLGRRLAEGLGPEDLVARFGADEFIMLLGGVAEAAAALRLAQRLQVQIGNLLEIGGREVHATACIGIVLGDADGSVDGYLRDADMAMQRAKAMGRGQISLFDESLREQAASRLRLEQELRQALAEEQLELHYQPIVSLPGRRVLGFEALARWRHPERGYVSPAAFIPIAEDSGLIVPLGRWVVDAAARQIAQWSLLPGLQDDWYVSINVSSHEFGRRDLAAETLAVLASRGVPADRLKLEVTETALMQEPENGVRMLEALKDAGIRLCIDDFGTGYSSLAYLHRFPFDTLKIDRSFVTTSADDSDAIIASIVGLAKSLAKEVVAEGIETEADLARLTRLGCDAAQGFLIARPLPPAQAAALLPRIEGGD